MKVMQGVKGKIIAAAGMVVLTVLVSATLLTVFGGNTKTEPIPAEVTIQGKVYTATNKMEILEIVPNISFAELGYIVGGGNEPVPYSDVDKLPKRSEMMPHWVTAMGPMTNLWQETDYPNGEIKGFEDRNIFANAVFGSSKMSDKITVRTVESSKVTVEDIQNADMIYINPGNHYPGFKDAYNKMRELSAGVSGLSKSYPAAGSDTKINFSAEIALELVKVNVIQGKAIIFDNQSINWSNPAENDNFSKFGMMILGLTPEAFISEYFTYYQDGVHSGTRGSVYIENGVLRIRTDAGILAWESYMFINAAGGWVEQYPYFNPGGRNGLYLNDNVMSFSGYNLMEGIIKEGTTNVQDKVYTVGSDNYIATDFGNAREMYGVPENGDLPYRNVVQYILGEFPDKPGLEKVKALEIQPAGSYEYNNFEGAAKIMHYLGFDTSGLTEDNWSEYVEVNSVSSNGFNGMNEEIIATYDVILIGMNDEVLRTDYDDNEMDGLIYTDAGDLVRLGDFDNKAGGNSWKNTRLSGNDFTAKAFEKIGSYSSALCPLILADDLYYGNPETVSSKSRAYHLKDLVHPTLRANVVSVSQAANNFNRGAKDAYLYIKETRPVLTMTSPEPLKYSNGMVSSTGVDPDNVMFTGTLKGKPNSSYWMQIVIDRNGDGLYGVASIDDSNEVFGQFWVSTDGSGNASVNQRVALTSEAMGYYSWKLIARYSQDGENTTLVMGEAVDAFVVKGPERIVKVLQIMPEKDVTLNLKDSETFKRLFEDAASVTNIRLDMETIRTNEYEKWFEDQPYDGNYEQNNLLEEYKMVVIGFADSFANDDISNKNGALDNLRDFIAAGNSALFTHDSMFYHIDDLKVSNDSTSASKELTKAFRTIVGMDRYQLPKSDASGKYPGFSNMLIERRTKGDNGKDVGYTMFKKNLAGGTVSRTTSLKTTNSVDKLNEGQITQYPYQIGQTLKTTNTHAQWFQLDLEQKMDDNEEVIVWYTLGGTDFYASAGRDAVNNYYIYSKGNITYSGAGHAKVEGEPELRLFVNTIIRALAAGNNLPEIKVKDSVTVSENNYNVLYRDVEDKPVLAFTAGDLDLKAPLSQTDKSAGQFKSGMVYWDTDDDQMYTEGRDILLETYKADTINSLETGLYNGITKTIDFSADKYAGYRYSGLSIKETFDYNMLRIGIEVTDSHGATATASVKMIHRGLFELD